jgi:hypothetical protein
MRRRHTIRAVARRSPASRCDRIAELAQTLAPLLEDAADAGARKSGGMEFVGRGRGFTDADPTGSAALDPRRSQIRRAAIRATHLIEEAEATLEEASGVIANGYLRLDGQEWIPQWRSGRRRSATSIRADANRGWSGLPYSVGSLGHDRDVQYLLLRPEIEVAVLHPKSLTGGELVVALIV